MHIKSQHVAAGLGLALALGVLAALKDIAGVKVEDFVQLDGAKLPLDGAGIGYTAIFEVYVAALYVGKKVRNTGRGLRGARP